MFCIFLLRHLRLKTNRCSKMMPFNPSDFPIGWIGLRENLQETIDFPIKYGGFPVNFPLIQSISPFNVPGLQAASGFKGHDLKSKHKWWRLPSVLSISIK